MPKIIVTNEENSLNMQCILQSNKSYVSIINHITYEIKIIICNDIIKYKIKIYIIVDE